MKSLTIPRLRNIALRTAIQIIVVVGFIAASLLARHIYVTQ